MAGLTKEVIVDSAFELLDEVGIEGLTVRALAGRLGVKAPALYWHLSSKQELLDLMGTEVAKRVSADLLALPESLSFAAALRGYAVALRRHYLRHRDGARTFSGTRLVDPTPLRDQQVWPARLIARGIPLERIADMFDLVTSFVTGFVIEEQERAQSGDARYSIPERDRRVGADHHIAIEMGHLLFRPPDERFDRQLDIILRAAEVDGSP